MPAEIRWLLAAAGCLLPAALRSGWLREWHAEFWHSFGSGRGFRRQMCARALGAFPDAYVLLLQDYGIAKRIHDAACSRSAPVLFLALLMAAAALVTNGYSGGRNLLLHDDLAGLVLIAQPIPFLGGSSRIPAAQAEAWLRRSQTVAELGRWSTEDRESGGKHGLVCRADAAALALLSAAPVKPPCQRIEPLGSTVLPFGGVVARLRSGASMQEAEQELAQTATLHKGWARPGVVALSNLRRAPLAPVGSALLSLVLLSVLAVRARTVRAWVWGASKIALGFALIGGVWIEVVARAPFTETAGIPVAWSALVYLSPVLAGGAAAWWFRRDARRHCRICYRPLTMPVLVGAAGSCLFEPGGTEYLCGAGHGALFVGSASEDAGEEVWATWSDNWA